MNTYRFDDSTGAVYRHSGDHYRWCGNYYGYGINSNMSDSEKSERVEYVDNANSRQEDDHIN